MAKISRENNFDLIRLLAALQVVLGHGIHHLKIESDFLVSSLEHCLKYLPGVPIFFLISGFLIYASFDRNSDDLARYFRNRFIRIYPGLWVCILVTAALLLYDWPSDIFSLLSTSSFWIWLFAELSIAQFYTPEILRFWGVGAPNGSLWTITVELQFYVIVPLIGLLSRKISATTVVIFVCLISVIANIYIGTLPEDSIVTKLGNVTVLPYLYYFGFGMLAYRYWDKIKQFFEGKFLIWLLLYAAVVFTSVYIFDLAVTEYFIHSPMNLVADILLAGLTLSAGYTGTRHFAHLLRGNDISYGIYIYHMLIVNFMVHRELFGSPVYLLIAFIATIVVAFVSWKLVEQPLLRRKNKVVKP